MVSCAPMAARRTIRRTSCRPPNGGDLAPAQSIDHLADQRQLGADALGIGARFELPGQLLAERTSGVAGKQLADLVEFQQLQRVCVHFHRIVHVYEDSRATGLVRRRKSSSSAQSPFAMLTFPARLVLSVGE